MTIFINNTKIPYFFFDDEDTIITKYALSKNTLPSYFRITTENFILGENSKINVEDVRDRINIKNPPTRHEVLDLSSLYPKLLSRDILLLFLIKKYEGEEEKQLEYGLNIILKDLKEVDRSFSNVSNIMNMLEYYKETEKKTIQNLKDYIQQYEKYIKDISNLPQINCENLQIEEITIDIKLEINFGTTLIDIFDSLDVSEKIPFLYIYRGSSLISKVYKNFDIPEDWIENISDEKNKIHFKILNSKKSLTEKNINKIYSDGWWDEFNNIEITMVNNYLLNDIIDQKFIENSFFSSFDESLQYKKIKSSQSGIRSIFKINNFNFNKVILSDMIDNLDMMSFFMFVNEYQSMLSSGGKSLTATTKNRFMVYFNPGNLGDIKNSISLTITPSQNVDEEWVIVRISKSNNYQKAESVKKIFCLLLSFYVNQYDKTFDIYKNLLPGKIHLIQKYKSKIKKGLKEDKKTGKRLNELKKQRPYTFRSKYSELCQPMERQPYLIPPSKVEDIRNAYGDHKIMPYKDPRNNTVDYYACEPREENERHIYIYPGLRKNTSKNKDYEEQVPYLPCCFTEDQYTKKGSELKKQSSQILPEDDQYKFIELEDVNDIGHILGYNKSAPMGRFGQMPYYMNFMMKNAHYTEILRGKQMVYPVFRYGMMQTPDSFFHCLEKTQNMKYASLPLPSRKKLILEQRKKMADGDLSALKQEFYDYSEKAIRKILLDEDAYIDPGMWISLAEEFYKCNIFIFETSNEFPNGAIVFPRFSNVYLSKKKNKSRPYILIMKNTTEKDWPFQCELIAKYTPEDRERKIFFTFNHEDKFIREIEFQFNNANKVYTIIENEKILYKPISPNLQIFKDVESQYIDGKGKTRILFFNDLCLMVSPIPPLNIETKIINNSNDLIYAVSFQKVNSFVKKYNLEILSQKVENGKTVGFFVKFQNGAYIPVSKSNIEKGIHLWKKESNVLNPFDNMRKSKMEILNRNKKIAMIMMQYTLFEYSFDPSSFSKNSFIVIENYNYDGINRIGKFLIRHNEIIYKDEKLIVQTENMRDKLLSYLKIELLNDKPSVLKYKERVTLKDYYSKIRDYRHTQTQNLFINFTSLREWLNTKNNSSYKIESIFKHSQSPYFYKNYNISSTTLFLLQSVETNALKEALFLCVEWKKSKINLGHFSKGSIVPESVSYLLYCTAGLLSKHDHSHEEYYSVLKVEDKYYAMLPFY